MWEFCLLLISGQYGKPTWALWQCWFTFFFFLFPLQGNIQRKRCLKSNAGKGLPAAQGNFLPIQKKESPSSSLGYTQGWTGCSSAKTFYENHKMQENRLPKAKSFILYVFFHILYHILSFNLIAQTLPEKQAERSLDKADTSLATSLSFNSFESHPPKKILNEP